jgi:hypothetical protein
VMHSDDGDSHTLICHTFEWLADCPPLHAPVPHPVQRAHASHWR